MKMEWKKFTVAVRQCAGEVCSVRRGGGNRRKDMGGVEGWVWQVDKGEKNLRSDCTKETMSRTIESVTRELERWMD